MSITLTITGESAVDILSSIKGFVSAAEKTEIAETETPEKVRKPRAQKTEEPKVTTPLEDEDDGLGGNVKAWTKEEIQALGAENAKRVGPELVRNLVKAMGADKLPNMDPSKYTEFAEKVVKLKPVA